MLHVAAAPPRFEEEGDLCCLHWLAPAFQLNKLVQELALGSLPDLWPTLTQLTVLQQKRRPHKDAKSITQEEFCDRLEEIIEEAYYKWDNPDTFEEVKFMYDNPQFHQLDERAMERLELHGFLRDRKQLLNPPAYSGDFMQCIEHVHGIICHKWWKARLGKDLSELWEDWEAELQAIFKRAITAEGVTKNCHKVVRLCEHILQEKTGGYAPPNLV